MQTAFFDKFADSGTQDFLGDAYCVKAGKSTVQKWVVKVLILQAGIGGGVPALAGNGRGMLRGR